MMKSTMFGKASVLPCLGLAALLGACSSDNGTTAIDAPVTADAPPAKVFTVTLTAAGETPACASAGASAAGSATVTIAGDGSSVAVTSFAYSGLSGAVAMGHIHFGTAAAPGPVVLPFSTLTTPISQTFHAADYVAATGAPADFATFVTMLRAGGHAYLNLHTAACPGGEIRGEIQ